MKTLLTTDGSEQASAAMEAAGRLLTHNDNHFDSICVIPEFRAAAKVVSNVRLRADYEVRMRAEAEKLLEKAGRDLRTIGIRAGRIIDLGSPADTLIERAADYDVVVAGVRNRNERAGPGLGSIAGRIVQHADTTVLIGRPLLNEKSFRILVALDGSAASENAVETLRTSFRLTDADITLMHVVEKPWLHLELEEDWAGGVDPGADDVTEESELEKLFAGELQVEADRIIERARRRLAGNGVGTESLVVEGNPGKEILRQAETGEYDLAVLGATGASDLKHSMLGSVSFRVASDAPCSVAVVR